MKTKQALRDEVHAITILDDPENYGCVEDAIESIQGEIEDYLEVDDDEASDIACIVQDWYHE